MPKPAESEPSSTQLSWGKVILLGEHAVVYGHHAIAGAISRGVRCSRQKASTSRLQVEAWQLDLKAEDDHLVAKAFRAMLQATKVECAHLTAHTNLPAGAGLGSSAALCVAIARALRPTSSASELEAFAAEGEACFHDNASGIDAALSAGGGIGVYTKEAGLSPLECPQLPLVIGLSGVPRSTAKMVSELHQRLQANPGLQSSLLDIAKLTRHGVSALNSGSLRQVGLLMNHNHRALQRLGVSIARLDAMVEAAQDAGALGAKLTGAGGGGAIIALAPGRQAEVQRALQSMGCESFLTTLGASS